jgi:hypothetical protein
VRHPQRGRGIREPIVTPEQLRGDRDGGHADDAARVRAVGRVAQRELERGIARGVGDLVGVETDLGGDLEDVRGLAEVAPALEGVAKGDQRELARARAAGAARKTNVAARIAKR